MPRKQTKKQLIYFLTFVSLFSFLLVIAIALSPPEVKDSFLWRKQSTGLLFIFVCILGMVSVFFPRQCSGMFHEGDKKGSGVSGREREGFQRSSKVLGVVLTHGHHPECQGFRHHEFRVGEKSYCVACMGLFLGAVLAILGVFSYFFSGWLVGIDGLLLIVFGVTGVALCLLQYTFLDVHSGLIRFSINAFFIFGMFLILAGIDFIVQSLTLNFFLILLFIFWLFTRILLSKSKHEEICQTCDIECNNNKSRSN